MKKINYIVKEPIGIHARPAGLLVKATQQYESTIMIENKGKVSDAKKIIAILTLGIMCGEEVVVTIEGKDEEKAYIELQKFFTEHI